MKALIATVRFIVFTNIYVSFCVLCFASKTALILFGNTGNAHVNTLIFCGTLFLYGFHRLYLRSRLTEEEHKEERHRWVDEHKKLYSVVIVGAFVAAVVQLCYMPFRVYVILMPIGIIAAGYSIPFIKTKQGFMRLRDIGWLKAFWIGLACSMLVTFLPLVYLHPFHAMFQPQVLFVLIENFLFAFVLAVPFDIRDLSNDRHKGTKTLPVLLGVKGTINLCIGLLCLFFVVGVCHYQWAGLSEYILLAFFISAAELMLFIRLCKPERPNLFFPLAIESAMIMQWLLVMLVVYQIC